MPTRRQLIFFPILFAIYPALNLYAHNAGSVEPSKGLLPVALIAAFMTLLYVAVSRLIRQSTSAALFSTAIGIFLFYYGYLFNGLREALHFTPQSYRLAHTVFLTVWVFGLIVVCLNLYRRRRVKPTLNSYLNFLSLVMVALPLVTLTPHLLAGSGVSHEPRAGTPLGAQIALAQPPDVYYIILDGYGRDDVLAEYFNFDNSDFLAGLEARGFYVAQESCANYTFTAASLPSALNLDYLDVLVPGAGSTAVLAPLFRENVVLRSFNELGYTTIHFTTILGTTRESPHSDIHYRYDSVDPYDQYLVETTLLAPLMIPSVSHEHEMMNLLTLEQQRAVTIETLHQLKRIPTMPEPTFTFAHLIIPHPPYLFDRNGNLPDFMIGRSGLHDLTQWQPASAYVEQAIYINGQIAEVIDAILSQSQTPPIIIVQGDHGPQTRQQLDAPIRVPILNAYHLPEEGNEYLYPDISPVNSFRLVLDVYFGTSWGLVEDVYHFSDYGAPMAMVDTACPPRTDSDND